MEQARFAYDPMGRRVEKVTNGEATSYVNDQTTILRETRGASKWLYVHGVGLDEPLESSTSAATSYFHADGLGSIVTQTTADGSPTLSRQYDAWGTLEVGAGAPGYSFTGREWDSEVGLYHYRARYYDPRMGRFVSEDPVHFRGGLNFYVYADAQPTTVTDPSGHEPMPLPPGMVPTNWVTFFCREYGFCPRPPPPPPPPPRGCDGTPCTPRTDWWAYFGCLMYNAPKPETFYSAPKAVTGGGLHLRCWMASQVCAEGGLQCFCGSHDGPSGPGTPQVPHNRGPSGPAAPGWHGGR